MTSVDDAWDILNDAQGSTCDGQIPQVETLTSEYQVPYDQRRSAQAKQDGVCNTVSAKVALPTWPPKAPVDRPAASRGKPIAAGRPQAQPVQAVQQLTPPAGARQVQAAQVAQALTPSPGAAANDSSPESPLQRCMRCTQGMIYDVQNWNQVQPPSGENKIMYILSKHDRAPVSACWVLLLFLVVVLSIAAATAPKRSQRQTDALSSNDLNRIIQALGK